MSLYLTVLLNKSCPNCGFKKNEWQSKDITDNLGYSLSAFQGVKLKDIKEGYAYMMCYKCRYWTDIIIKDGKIVSEKCVKDKKY